MKQFDEVDGVILEAAMASEKIAVFVGDNGEFVYGAADGSEISLEQLVSLLVLPTTESVTPVLYG